MLNKIKEQISKGLISKVIEGHLRLFWDLFFTPNWPYDILDLHSYEKLTSLFGICCSVLWSKGQKELNSKEEKWQIFELFKSSAKTSNYKLECVLALYSEFRNRFY